MTDRNQNTSGKTNPKSSRQLFTYNPDDANKYCDSTIQSSPPKSKKHRESPRAKFGGAKSGPRGPERLMIMRDTKKEEPETLQYLRKKLKNDDDESMRAPTLAYANLPLDAPDVSPTTPENTYDPSSSQAASMNDNEEEALQTGEDAISFFVQQGGSGGIKFVHLNRRDTKCHSYRPYDLVVVSAQDTKPEYFTMSISGLVHVSPGCPSEFIPLSEWMRHSTLFNVCSSIRFFKYYLVTKCFSNWKRNVRFKLFGQQRKKLASHLFLGKNSFCTPLLEVKKVMMDMQSIMLLDSRPQKTYEIHTWTEYQATKRTEASKQFELCIERIHAIVQHVCTDVTNQARNNDAFEAVLQGHDLSFVNEKTKSIVTAKIEAQEKKRILKQAMEEAGMIADFIRLVDYIAVENQVALCIRSCDEFLHELLKVPRKTGYDSHISIFIF